MYNILFNTWPGAFMNPGGGEVQLQNSRDELLNLGYSVDLYNQWLPQKNCDIFHQFSIELGTESVIKEYKSLNKPIALSPIMWNIFDKDSFRWFLTREIFKASDIIMTNSNIESRRLSNALDIDITKFHPTRNSVPEEFLTIKCRKDFKNIYNIQGNFVLSVANIDRRKNTKVLCELCAKHNIPLVIIGEIRDLYYIEEFKEDFEKAIYLGPIYDKEVLKSAYQQCTIFALPSQCETPGISALEAGSQGAQILITEEGATREYFLDYVEYVNPNDYIQIENKLLDLFESSSSNDNNTNLQSYIKEKYTWHKTAIDIKNGYEKILK